MSSVGIGREQACEISASVRESTTKVPTSELALRFLRALPHGAQGLV